MNSTLIVNAALLAAAFCAAASVERVDERRAAAICAAVLFPIWAVFSLAFDPSLNPAHFVSRMLGVKVISAEIWTTLDLIGGATACMIAWRFWWGRALWAMFFVQTVLHALRWKHGMIGREAYYGLLDKGFYGQIALFLMIGGGRLVGFITMGIGRIGRFCVPAFLEAKQAIANGRA